jgi:hypothetical protein
MKVFELALYISFFLYSFLFDLRFLFIYSSVLFLYYSCALLIPSGKFNGTRRKLQIASWDEPTGTIIVNWNMDVTYVQEFLD